MIGRPLFEGEAARSADLVELVPDVPSLLQCSRTSQDVVHIDVRAQYGGAFRELMTLVGGKLV